LSYVGEFLCLPAMRRMALYQRRNAAARFTIFKVI